jgi:hypothetical protein
MENLDLEKVKELKADLLVRLPRNYDISKHKHKLELIQAVRELTREGYKCFSFGYSYNLLMMRKENTSIELSK